MQDRPILAQASRIIAALSDLAAGCVVTLFARLAAARFVSPLVLLTVLVLLGVSMLDVYHTPHSSSGPYSNLTGLFD